MLTKLSKWMKNMSKHDKDKGQNNVERGHEIKENVGTTGISSAPVDMSSNEEHIASQFQEVLDIHSKRNTRRKEGQRTISI